MNADFIAGVVIAMCSMGGLWLILGPLREYVDMTEQLQEQLEAAIEDYNKERQKVKSMKGRLKYLEKRNRERV